MTTSTVIARRMCGVGTATLGSTYILARAQTATTATTECDANVNVKRQWEGTKNETWNEFSTPSTSSSAKREAYVRKRMTAIGRFSLKSETPENLSIPTFFVALSGNENQGCLTVPEFTKIWHGRNMPTLHPRFHSRVSAHDDRYFEQPHSHDEEKPAILEDDVRQHVTETLGTSVYRSDLRKRIERFLTSPLDVMDKLWEVQIFSGPLGSSGAISKAKREAIVRDSPETTTESVLLFRSHHALADGVSLIAAFADLSDEAEEIRDIVRAEIKKRKRKREKTGFLKRLERFVKGLIWFCLGSIRALLAQMYLMVSTRSNPFKEVLKLSLAAGDPTKGRSISWCDVASLDEVKAVARAVGDRVTVNDLFVSCVTAAVARQLAEHRERFMSPGGDDIKKSKQLPLYHHINLVCPVHLSGGFLLPGKSVGNHIGAFAARVPGEMGNGTVKVDTSAVERLRLVHDSLSRVKATPAPVVSYLIAKFCATCLPERLTKRIFLSANANATFVLSNARGSPKKLHLNGRAIESSAGFLPLPPGIPIGIIVQSYAGNVSMSVTAEKWAVPDADKFMSWILEEYRRLLDEAEAMETK